MSDIFSDANFGEASEVKSMTLDWGLVGDYILGTFVKARHNVETQFGVNSIYEIYAEKGSFHKLIGKGKNAKPVEEATAINKGDTWSIWGRGDIMTGMMNSLRPGQVVKLTFTAENEGKNGMWKEIKINMPKNNEGKPLMNDEWIGNQGLAGIDM